MNLETRTVTRKKESYLKDNIDLIFLVNIFYFFNLGEFGF